MSKRFEFFSLVFPVVALCKTKVCSKSDLLGKRSFRLKNIVMIFAHYFILKLGHKIKTVRHRVKREEKLVIFFKVVTHVTKGSL